MILFGRGDVDGKWKRRGCDESAGRYVKERVGYETDEGEKVLRDSHHLHYRGWEVGIRYSF